MQCSLRPPSPNARPNSAARLSGTTLTGEGRPVTAVDRGDLPLVVGTGLQAVLGGDESGANARSGTQLVEGMPERETGVGGGFNRVRTTTCVAERWQ